MGIEIADFDIKSKKAFRPYGSAIGEIVYHWNKLHSELCDIFAYVSGCPRIMLIAAVWHATDSDYQQRKMLRSILPHAEIPEVHRSCIVWLLNEIDNGLRHNRNDAIHMPLSILLGDKGERISFHYVPELLSPSPRAQSSWKKNEARNFLLFLREQAKWAETLSKFARDLDRAIADPERVALPEKPPQPRAHRKKSHAEDGRRTRAK